MHFFRRVLRGSHGASVTVLEVKISPLERDFFGPSRREETISFVRGAYLVRPRCPQRQLFRYSEREGEHFQAPAFSAPALPIAYWKRLRAYPPELQLFEHLLFKTPSVPSTELCSIAISSKVWASSHATIYSCTCVRHRRLKSGVFSAIPFPPRTGFHSIWGRVHVPTNVHRASRCRSDHLGALLRRTPPSTDANATCVHDIFVATDLDVRATYRVPGVNEEDRGLLWVSFAQSDILLLTTTAPVTATPSKLALVSKDGERASGPHFTMKRREGGSRERPTFELRSDSEAQSWPK